MSENQKIAVVRIRGGIGVRERIKKALNLLRLYRQNYCVVIPNTPSYMGQLFMVKDFVTWGEINDETYNSLVEKRGEPYTGRLTDGKGKVYNKKFIIVNNKNIKPFFRLNPPRKGFERKGIKKSFRAGGALGYRKDDINDLLKRMM
jgi:large subunit ribosomal protein L30